MEKDLAEIAKRALLEHIECHSRVAEEQVDAIVEIARHLAGVLLGSGTVWICGNGGSAADAAHLATELVGRFAKDRDGFRVAALGTNMPLLTAVANDLGYEQVFARELESLARAGDVLVAISTSGASANVVEAVRVAREKGLTSIAVAGGDGGELAALTDLAFCAPSNETPRIQEVHGTLWHIVCCLLEDVLMVRSDLDAD